MHGITAPQENGSGRIASDLERDAGRHLGETAERGRALKKPYLAKTRQKKTNEC